MTLPKHLGKRGKIYQFSRRVPQDVAKKLGCKFWRFSLETDSLTEAERKCHHEIARTDQLVEDARNGNLRKLDNDTALEWAMRWLHWYNENSQATLPQAMLGSRYPGALAYNGDPIGDETVDPIISSRTQLADQVRHFVVRNGLEIDIPSPDWEQLLDDCQDEYHYGNPEVTFSKYYGTLGPTKVIRNKALLESVFRKFSDERLRPDADDPITPSSLKDYGVAIVRFVHLYGNKDVEDITRSEAEEFRDLLRQLPSRPPDAVRRLPLREQITWAHEHDHKRLARDTVAKLITGMLSVLNFVYEKTAIIKDRKGWENPFKGFAGTGRRSSEAKRLNFNVEQIPHIFDPALFQPRKPSHFWVPLLLLYTGARRDEIAQLHLMDIHPDADVPYIRISEETDPSLDLEENPEATKRIKTWSSARVAPLLPQLFEIGFREYVAWATSRNDIHLFPDLPHKKGGDRSNKLSTSFTNHLRKKVKLTDERQVLHSLRHTFEMMAITSGVTDDRRKLALGRYIGDDVSLTNYTIHFRDDEAAIKEHVHDRITFPELDLVGLGRHHQKLLNYIVKK